MRRKYREQLENLAARIKTMRPETFELVERRLFEDKGSGSADD